MDYTLGITNTLDKIFGGVLLGELDMNNPKFEEITKTKNINTSRFLANFPSNIFQNEYAIFYSIIKIKKITIFDANDVSTILENNRDLVLDSPYVDLSKMMVTSTGAPVTDDEKIAAIIANMVDKLKELSNRVVSEAEFNSSCVIFIDYFKNQYMLETAQLMSRIMSDEGAEIKKPGKRTIKYIGFDDTKRFYNERTKVLNELSEQNRVRTTIIDSEWYNKEQQMENTVDDKALLTIGIKAIDEITGELRRSNMLGILGPPKGGKTRFTNYLVRRALMKGLNVCVWPLEGTKEEWMSMQTASYIAQKNGEKHIFIDSKNILQRKLDSPQEREIVQSAKFEMVSNPSYGQLSFIESAAYIEDFISILESHYDNDNPFDVIVIDSLVNILSKTGRNKVDRISAAYMELKDFISNRMKRPALAIIPAQLKQDVVDYLRSHPNETIDVTAGGESSETVRSPDEVLGLFSTKQERAAGYMKIYSVASRHSAAFDDIQVRASLKCCYFYDE